MGKQAPLHLVFSTSPHVGHCRSLCTFVASLLLVPTPVVITVVIANVNGLVERVEKEIIKGVNITKKTEGSEARVISLPIVSEDEGFSAEIFRVTWRKLQASEPLVCDKTGRTIAPSSKPAAFVVDSALYQLFGVIRSEPDPCPVFNYLSAFAGAQIWTSGPESMGGRDGALIGATHPTHACKDGISIRALPHMKCANLVPQDQHKTGLQPMLNFMVGAIIGAERDCDGLLCISSEAYEGKQIMQATQDMLSRNGYRPVFNLGCMMPMGYGTSRANASISRIETTGQHEPVLEFLDRAEKKHGEKSVVYVSFGTAFPSPSMQHILILLRTLKDRSIPFIFTSAPRTTSVATSASAVATVAEYEALCTACTAEDLAFFTGWAPQQSILAHRALGWFVSHGGNNSTAEALLQGVPIIGWPMGGDQPLNIAHLARTLDVAFEVTTWNLGICTWSEWRQTRDVDDNALEAEIRGIVDALKGDEGMRKRANTVKVAAELRAECMEIGGRAYWEKDRFLRYCRGLVEEQGVDGGMNGA